MLFSGHASGNELSSDFIFTYDTSVLKQDRNVKSIPQYGDILIKKGAAFSYKYLQTLNQNKRQEYIINDKENVFVLQTVLDGRTLILKVLFEE